ncbi:MAG: DUF4446 family protein [Candidatus Paceibacterota bacterium]|jgi:hypothetical protein
MPNFDQIVIYVIAFFIILIIVWIIKTEKRIKKFFMGKKAKDLEETLLFISEQLKALQNSKNEIEIKLGDIDNKLKKSIRGVETIRFNPFKDSGGNQSFAITFINEEGDGVVLSSLYSRDRVSVFAKPLKNKKSEYELTEEEKRSIEKAEIK